MLDAWSNWRALLPTVLLQRPLGSVMQRRLRHWCWCLSTPRTQKERARGPAVLAPDVGCHTLPRCKRISRIHPVPQVPDTRHYFMSNLKSPLKSFSFSSRLAYGAATPSHRAKQHRLRHWCWCLSTPRTQKERTRGPAVLAPDVGCHTPCHDANVSAGSIRFTQCLTRGNLCPCRN